MPETAEQYIARILGHVEGQDPVKVQGGTAAKLKKLIKGLPPKKMKWKSSPDKWSIAQIVAHLADAEIACSWRLRQIASTNEVPIQAFDQNAWADAFAYEKQDPKKSVETFRVLRENNLALLKTLPKERWENYGMHQERGKETVAQVVRLYAGHDTNHLKQIEDIVAQLKKKRK